MPIEKLLKTKDSGVFYVSHPTRKHSVVKDRKIVLRYTIKGKTRKEVYGWESQGFSFKAAALKIETFRANAKSGKGPTSLREEREIERLERDKVEAERQAREEAEELENLTLDSFFRGAYLDAAQTSKKPKTVGTEVALYNKWVEPTMGHFRFRDIKPLHFEALKKKVLKGDRVVDGATGKVSYAPKSPRTLHYCVSIVVQVWNMAFDNGMVPVSPPKRKTLNLPMVDNERTRAFTPDEAKNFLVELQKRSPMWCDIASISLYCGLRASEVYKIKVEDFDEAREELFLRSPKKQISQTLVLNESGVKILKRLKDEHSRGRGLIFLNRKGEPITEVSDTVERVISDLGFNKGVDDRRDRLTFHNLRHTFATWLLDYSDADIFTISNLLRHSSLRMTRKYVHPNKEKMRDKAQGLCNVIDEHASKKSEEEAGQAS